MADWSFHQGDMSLAAVPLTGRDTPGGPANVKSAWGQLLAATPFEVAGFILHYGTSLPSDGLFDIGIGAAWSEQVIMSNLPVVGGNGYTMHHAVWFPLSIPAGVRLAIRNQFAGGAAYSFAGMTLYSAAFWGVSRLRVADTYGANEADSGGVSIEPGATANTKGAWVELTASTARNHKMLYVGILNAGNTTRTTCQWLLDVGVGAAGSEQVLVSNLPLRAHAMIDLPEPPMSGPFPMNVPAGSRLSVRAQCSINDATDRLFDCVLVTLS